MEGIMTIVLRTIFLYFFILVVFRLMGKREIGQLSVLDLVVSIMIAELAVLSIEEPKTPLLRSIVGIGVLFLVQIIMAFVSLKNEKVRHYMDGRPSTIIDKGKIDEDEMRRQRYNFDDLLVQLRENKVKNVSDVEFAILEPTGKLSVFEKQNASQTQDQDQNEDSETADRDADFDLPLPLILDGRVQKENLDRIEQTSLWLRQQMRKWGYNDIKKISYCEMNPDGTFFIDEKDEY